MELYGRVRRAVGSAPAAFQQASRLHPHQIQSDRTTIFPVQASQPVEHVLEWPMQTVPSVGRPERTTRSEQKSCYFRHCAGFVSCTQLATDLDSPPRQTACWNKEKAERIISFCPLQVGGRKKENYSLVGLAADCSFNSRCNSRSCISCCPVSVSPACPECWLSLAAATWAGFCFADCSSTT